MTQLHGPANPDQFRVKVGWYRHYFDNLPTDTIAPATTDTWPAVSSIKNAASKDWTYTSLKRQAVDLAPSPFKYVGKSETAIYNEMKAVNDTEMKRAQDRGIEVHEFIAARADNRDMELKPDAEQYRRVVESFLDDCQPDVFLSEVVVINRTIGYGGTGDAWCIINHPDFGKLLVDWKTRGDAGKHAAYDEECWQVGGGYFHGEYMIIEDNGQARRAAMPQLDGAAIVSLAPESYKIYPIDVAKSWDTFLALYCFWDSKRDTRFAGNPLYIRRADGTPAPAPITETAVTKLRAEIVWIKEHSPEGFAALAAAWPTAVRTFKDGGPEDADQATVLAMLITWVKKQYNVPFNDADNPAPHNYSGNPPGLHIITS